MMLSTPTGTEEHDVLGAMRLLFLAIDRLYAAGIVGARSGVALERSLQQVILALGDTGPVRITELADVLDLSVPTVSRHVKRLEEARMLARTSDPHDGRAAHVELSPQGAATRGALVGAWETIFADALLRTPDAAAFAAGLQRFAAGIDELAARRPLGDAE